MLWNFHTNNAPFELNWTELNNPYNAPAIPKVTHMPSKKKKKIHMVVTQ